MKHKGSAIIKMKFCLSIKIKVTPHRVFLTTFVLKSHTAIESIGTDSCGVRRFILYVHSSPHMSRKRFFAIEFKV